MRMPEAGPFGDTRFDARLLAIVAASVVKSPAGGCVESLVTDATPAVRLPLRHCGERPPSS